MADKAARKKDEGKVQPDMKKGEPSKPEPDFIDLVAQPFGRWFDFIRTEPVRYYLGILRINILSLLAGWALLVLFLLVVTCIAFALFGALLFTSPAGVLQNISGSIGAILAIAVLFLIGILMISWAKTSIELCAYDFTDSQFGKRGFAIKDTLGRIKWPAFRFMLIESAIWVVIMIPLAIIAALLIGALALVGDSLGALGPFVIVFLAVMAEILAFIYLIFMSIAFGFFSQFWRFGFLIDGRGVMESLRAGVRIIIRRPLEVICFDLGWLLVGLLFSLPLILFSTVGGFFIGLFRSLAIMSLNPILWAVLLIVLVMEALITALLSSLVQAFSLPTLYLFWKRMKDM
jgi:hypothetical protein